MIRCIEYTEHGSKNHPESSHQLNPDNKVVTQFAKPELGDKFHVYLLELYLSKLPDSAVPRDIFYMKAKIIFPILQVIHGTQMCQFVIIHLGSF